VIRKSKLSSQSQIPNPKSKIPNLPLDHYELAAMRHFAKLHGRYLQALPILVRSEQALDIVPSELVDTFFPLDPFPELLGGAMDNNALCVCIENHFVIELPRTQWLPRLKTSGVDFARFYSDMGAIEGTNALR